MSAAVSLQLGDWLLILRRCYDRDVSDAPA